MRCAVGSVRFIMARADFKNDAVHSRLPARHDPCSEVSDGPGIPPHTPRGVAARAGLCLQVRLQGRLAKSPSFWVKTVDIVRTYKRIDGAVVPVALHTKAEVRFLGEATLRMTYVYSEIDGRPLASTR